MKSERVLCYSEPNLVARPPATAGRRLPSCIAPNLLIPAADLRPTFRSSTVFKPFQPISSIKTEKSNRNSVLALPSFDRNHSAAHL
jgi:hypothetical protein